MPDDPGIMVAPLFQRVPVGDLWRIDDRSPKIRREEEFRAAELPRRNAHDRVGVLIDLYGAPPRGGVAVELTVPEGVAQNDLRHAVFAVLFGSMDESSEIGLK